jgi:hypothetical protein
MKDVWMNIEQLGGIIRRRGRREIQCGPCDSLRISDSVNLRLEGELFVVAGKSCNGSEALPATSEQ